jgi:hypothetical protein
MEDFPDTPEGSDAYGNAYWKARWDFIHAGHSERFEEHCLAEEDGTTYEFQVEQRTQSGTTASDLPVYDDVDQAIAYLEAAPFAGMVQRYVKGANWLTAGIAYEKHRGIKDLWLARNEMPDMPHWHGERQCDSGRYFFVRCELCKDRADTRTP